MISRLLAVAALLTSSSASAQLPRYDTVTAAACGPDFSCTGSNVISIAAGEVGELISASVNGRVSVEKDGRTIPVALPAAGGIVRDFAPTSLRDMLPMSGAGTTVAGPARFVLRSIPGPDDEELRRQPSMMTVKRTPNGSASLALPLRIVDARIHPNGDFEFIVTGQLEGTIRVEGSDDLDIWAPLSDLTPSDGTVRYIDTSGSNARHRFYRVIVPRP